MGGNEDGPPVCPLLSGSLKAEKCPVDAHFMLYGPVYFLEHLRACPIVGGAFLLIPHPGTPSISVPRSAFRLIKAEPLYCDGGRKLLPGFFLQDK